MTEKSAKAKAPGHQAEPFDWAEWTQSCQPTQRPGYLLWQVMHGWHRFLEARMAALDLTHPQFVLLVSTQYLSERGLVSQRGLAEWCRLDAMQVSKVIRILERKALVERRAHPDDPRAKALCLTLAGRTLLRQALPIVDLAQADFFAPLGADKAVFHESMLRLFLSLEGRCCSSDAPL